MESHAWTIRSPVARSSKCPFMLNQEYQPAAYTHSNEWGDNAPIGSSKQEEARDCLAAGVYWGSFWSPNLEMQDPAARGA